MDVRLCRRNDWEFGVSMRMTRSLALFVWLFFGTIGLVVCVLSIRRASEGDILTTMVCLGFAAFCFGLTYPVRRALTREVSPSIKVDGSGLLLRPDRRIDIPMMISVISLTLSSASYAILAPFGLVDIPVPALNESYIPLFCAFVAFLGAPYTVLLMLRKSSAYIRLTPTGYELAQGFLPKRSHWSEVSDIRRAESADQPYTVIVALSDGSEHSIATAAFTPDESVVQSLLRYYWQHPDRRGELVDHRVADRLRNYMSDADA